MQDYKNHGLILEEKSTDYKLGVNSPIIASVRVPSLDWTPYMTANDPQSDPKMDTMGCTDFSGTHQVEMQMNWLLTNKKFNASQIAWLAKNGYVNTAGKIELSERFLCKTSGTTSTGSSFQQVWDSIRANGMIPIADWPFDQTMTFEQFYSAIPQNLLDKGKRFANTVLDALYEFLPTNGSTLDPAIVTARLAESPIQIAIPVPAYHAVSLVKQSGPGYEIYDHYPPYEYTVNQDYPINYALRSWITPKNFQILFNTNLKKGMSNDDVKKLQTILGIHAHGAFGPVTQQAVMNFQQAHGLMPDGVVGPLTEAALGLTSSTQVTPGAYPKIDLWCQAAQTLEGWSANPASPSYSNNNPGNLEFNNQPGAVQNGRWAKFDTYQDGYAALYRLFLHACTGASTTYQPTMTLTAFYRVYAPAGDGKNDPDKYAIDAAAIIGVSPDAQIKNLIS